jgi:hypothetical protein
MQPPLASNENRAYQNGGETIKTFDYHKGNRVGLLIAGLFVLVLGLAALLAHGQHFGDISGQFSLNRCMAFILGFKTQPQKQPSATPITCSFFRILHARLHIFAAQHTKELY